MYHGYASGICSMNLQHWHTAWTCKRDKKHGHTEWTYVQYEHAAWRHGHEAWHAAWTYIMDIQYGNAAWTCGMYKQHKMRPRSIDTQHGLATWRHEHAALTWTCITGMTSIINMDM
jgi:hypothetical protein